MSLERMLRGWRLTTAEIIYRLPDHPSILQSYVWQELDLLPHFPELKKFLDFWERKLDGKLFRVKVMHAEAISTCEVRFMESVGFMQ